MNAMMGTNQRSSLVRSVTTVLDGISWKWGLKIVFVTKFHKVEAMMRGKLPTNTPTINRIIKRAPSPRIAKASSGSKKRGLYMRYQE